MGAGNIATPLPICWFPKPDHEPDNLALISQEISRILIFDCTTLLLENTFACMGARERRHEEEFIQGQVEPNAGNYGYVCS